MPKPAIATLLPFLAWFKDYGVSTLKMDFVAGVTVALVLIPQSMAYAQLAGLPAYYGLYASFLPPLVAALFGSSRRLATGPVAVVSMMTAASLEPLAIAGSEAYIAYAVLLAFIVGLLQFLLGVLRLGIVVNLLSHPVVTGFTNAAAIIIASSQLPKLFGVHVDKAEHYFETIWRVVEAAFSFIHWPTFFMGLLALVVMVGLKKWNPRLPYVLVAVVITTTLSWFTGFENNRHVAIDDIRVPGFPSLILELNSNLDNILQTTSVRTMISQNVADRAEEDAEKKLCSSCHPSWDVNLEELKKGTKVKPAEHIPLAKVLELHLMAGVLDQYLAEEKMRGAALRKKLRSMQLVSVQGANGSLYYVLKESVPREKWAEKNIWRIMVGNKPLDPEQILLVGGGEVIGMVPGGLPELAMPAFDLSVVAKLIVPAIIISILGFMEAISIAKAIAARTGGRLDPNQELIGQGLANMVGSFGRSYPVSGSFSRSAVNFQAGAQTGMSSVFTSLAVVVALLFCTPLLYHLPQSVLAAIIMMAVVGLLNIHDIKHAYTVKKSDGVISVITFVATLLFAPHLDKGILLGVALTVGVFFYRKMKPIIAELSLWEDGHYRNARRFRLERCKHISVIRFDGPLFFANISYLEDEVLKIVASMPELKIIHFKCNGINDIDASGESALALLVDRLRSAGYDVYFSGLKEHIIDIMRRTGLLMKIGEDHIFPTLASAIENIWHLAHAGSTEEVCPLKKVLVKG
ncbi:SulP family inorganic anion transporter [Desulfolithobacter sp.]